MPANGRWDLFRRLKVKLIYAQQAKLINNYWNTNYKLIKTNAAVWYDKIRRR